MKQLFIETLDTALNVLLVMKASPLEAGGFTVATQMSAATNCTSHDWYWVRLIFPPLSVTPPFGWTVVVPAPLLEIRKTVPNS